MKVGDEENINSQVINTGLLSDVDIQKFIDKRKISITPFNESNLTPVGYNLTFTKFIYSVNKDLLIKIEKDEKTRENYCFIPQNDTVLILTNEAVWVSEEIAGTFHSKVGIVSKGFGHIGTTLDPKWEDPLLISLNNPTKNRIKLIISSEEMGVQKYKSFVTLILYKMLSPSKGVHDNLPSRIDILKDKMASLTKKSNYKELVGIIEKILNFESIRVGISKYSATERPLKINEFEQKYSNFSASLNENISDAQKISGKIKYWKNVKYGTVLTILLILGILGTPYLIIDKHH